MNAEPTAARQILLVEDNPGDADLICGYLAPADGSDHRVVHVGTLAAAAQRLALGRVDAILLDLHLPDGVGVECVMAIRRCVSDVPIIAFTGMDDDELALRCIAAGAQDHLAKHEIRQANLRRAVGYAIERTLVSTERRRADRLRQRLAAIVEGSRDAIVSCSVDGLITSWNQGAQDIFAYAADEAIGQPVHAIIRPEGAAAPDALERRFFQSRRDAAPSGAEEVVRLRKDGSAVTLSVVTSVVRDAAGEVAAVAAIFRDITEMRRRDDELRRHVTELAERDLRMRALTARLNTLREEERTRISREVHDGLGQLLTGLKMDLRWMSRRLGAGAPPTTLAQRLAEADKLVDQTIVSVQRIAVELRPSALDALGLPAAIRDEARRFEARTGVATAVDIRSATEPEPEVATALFRILQELMTNVARHAHAGQMGITLEEQGGERVLQVTDDGVGIAIDGAAAATSLGLLGMSERAQAVGGSFRLARQPQGGTVATVRVPRAATTIAEAGHAPRPDRR